MTSLGAAPHVGRRDDRERLSGMLAQLRAGLSAALVLSGEAGMGKTLLLRRTIEDAAGIQALTVSGYESEIQLGFATLLRLLRPLLDGLNDLPDSQKDALNTTFGLTSGPAPSRFLVGLGTQTLLEQAARSRPLLCVIDDVQWVDQESQDALAFVARRADAEGLGLLFGLRSGTSAPRALAGIPEHPLPPLPDQDMRSLLRGAARTSPPPHVVARLVDESKGNPLALLEYVASLSPEHLSGVVELPPALPVSARLSERFGTQVAQLPHVTREFLLVLSAADIDEADAVSEACRRLGIDPDAALPALRNSLLTASPRLAFRHPLIRSVVYGGADVPARRRVHAVLADVANQNGSPDISAWHRALATSGADEQVATQLELAAGHAQARGGYAAQATFLTLAAHHSTRASDDHARRLLAAVQAHIIAGNGAQSERLLEGWNPTGWPAVRVAASRVAATISVNVSRTGGEAALLAAAADELPTDDIEFAWQLRCGAFFMALETRTCTEGTTVTELAKAIVKQPISTVRRPTSVDALYEALATRCVFGYRAAASMLRQALPRIVEPGLSAHDTTTLLTWLVMEDLWDDEFQTTTWARLTALNRAEGAWGSTWIGLGSSAITEARHGHFDTAQELFDETTSLSADMGVDNELLWGALVEFRAWQGREEETRSMADRLISFWGGSRRFGTLINSALLALTVLELSLGHYASALAHARRVAEDDPPGHGSRILPELIEAAVRAGEDVAAAQALDELTVRANAAGTPWALGVLERSRAVALTVSDSAGAHYEQALNLFSTTPLITETARTRLVFGEWLRRRKRRGEAREHLDAAWGAFTEMGATLFAQRAARELAAAGFPPLERPATSAPRSASALTPQERRVSELAARGMTNSEISELLFLSASTVDYHLSKVFRKLHITSRRRLRETLDR